MSALPRAVGEEVRRGATETYEYTGLTRGTNYTISVEAHNSEGWGVAAYVQPVTTRDVPLQVTTLMVGFSNPPQGEEFSVMLKGQSCEKSLVNEMDSDEVVSNEKKAAGDATNAAAMSLA